VSESVTVDKYPKCDFCATEIVDSAARYDAKTMGGPWANMCERHFEAHGVGLGTGQGQRLIERPSPPESPMDTVERYSKLWIGAEVIGYTKGGDQMDVQIRLNDGTVVRVDGLVKLDPNHSSNHMDLDTIDLDHDLGLRDLTDPFTGEMV